MSSYPLGQNEADTITSKTGKKLSDITLDEVKRGNVQAEDIKISPEMLKRQGQVAKEADNPQMEANFQRASELANVPDEVILNMYNKLRPNRSTKTELVLMAQELLENTVRRTVQSWFWKQQRFMKKGEFFFETDCGC